MIRFIGVSFGVIDNKLVCIATSERYSAVNMKGFSTREALAFLSSVSVVRDKIIKAQRLQARTAKRPALVGFDTAVDLELVLRDLSPANKDILFGLYRNAENRNKDLPIFDPYSPEYRGIVNTKGYRLSALPGKIFKIAVPKRAGLIYYDIAGYFEGENINEAASTFLGVTPSERLEKNLLPLWTDNLGEALMDRCEAQAKLIVRLADRVADVIEPLEISPRQWYGPSAIAARCLTKWEARKQAKRLNEKNSPYELIKAIDCAYFGGRVEAFKLGTITDVNTYDLNSAYAYATTLLSQFHTPLRFTRTYRPDAPFSCWLVRYQLPESVSLGVLPTRHSRGGISFRREGMGYFWQPEVDYLRQRYPGCFSIAWGYVGPEYKPVTFADAINDMYDYRQRLKAQGDAGESIIKLALSNLYGKFAQNTGSAHFQCRAWAGWITSLVRRLLLEAVTGIEDKVICFCQDAVHLAGATLRNVTIGEGLGEWKTKRFASGLYVSPGIYTLTPENVGRTQSAQGSQVEAEANKTAERGSNLGIDFDRVAAELSSKQVSELTRSFFVGWVLSRQSDLKYGGSYLQEVQESLSLIPGRIRARNYLSEFDWTKDYRDSEINSRYSGQLSARYIPSDQMNSGALRIRLKDRGWL